MADEKAAGKVGSCGSKISYKPIYESDERWTCRNVVELVSASIDTFSAAIGTSPILGDMGRTGVQIPLVPTVDQSHRYLFRLCGMQIPNGASVKLLGLRQFATIGLTTPCQSGLGSGVGTILEIDVQSPLWTFPNGNISWHVRYQPNVYAESLDTQLLFNTIFPYVPPAHGLPPGNPVGHLGTIRDLRYPWQPAGPGCCLDTMIRGPGSLVMYASVHQPNTETLCADLFGGSGITSADLNFLRPEDRFLLLATQSPEPASLFYTRVGGAMLIETFPVCPKAGFTS